MSYHGGLPLPPLGLPPLSTLPTSGSSNTSRIDPGAGILPPPRHPRTPSMTHQHHPVFPPLPSLSGPSSSNRPGAMTVPPPQDTNLFSSSTSKLDIITPRTTACLPCKKSHLKCGKGMRPCNQCLKRGKSPEECLQGIPSDQAQLFLRLYREKKDRELNINHLTSAHTPVFDDDPLFPPSSSSARPSSSSYPSLDQTFHSKITYPPLGQLDDSMPTISNHVTLIMSQDFKIGRASQECLRTFGYHPHEMCKQSLTYYLPLTEREKWRNFSMKLFSPMNPPVNGLPLTPVELARLPFAELTVPVKDMRSIVGHYHFRHHSREMVPVRIELWFGSYFGATTNDFSTFRNAIIVARIVARISPTGSAVLPSSSSLSTTIHPLSTSLSTYPSVLLPAPGSSSSSETFAVPRRSRTPSIGGGAASGSSPSIRPPPSLASFGSGSSSRLPPLPSLTSNPSATLPPFGTLGALPPLGVLPPLGTFPSPGISHNTTPRKRRTSTIATPLLDRYDHGSGFSGSGSHLTSRPRLRSPTPQSGHRRSISSEAGHSNYSTTSSSSSFENSFGDRHGGPSVPLEAFPPIQRPPSRNRRSSQFDMMNTFENGSGAVPHIPILLPESPSKSSSFFLSNHHLDYMNHSPYKPKKQSYIAIDDSFNPPSPPPPPPQRSSDPSSSLALNSQLHHSTSLDCDRSHLPQNYEWLPLAGLPSSFASLSLDSPESQHSPTDSQY